MRYLLTLAILAPLCIGCGTLQSGQIMPETSQMIVRTVQDIAAAAHATQVGLASMKADLQTSNAALAQEVEELEGKLEPVVTAATTVADEAETSPLNQKDADGNPLPTSPLALIAWAAPLIAAYFTKRYADSQHDKKAEKAERKDAIGKMSPEEFDKFGHLIKA